MSSVRIVGLMLLLVLAATVRGAEVQTLPDGRRITLLQVVEVEPETGARTLVLEYQTELPLTDTAALAAEVDAVWAYFRPTVEAAGVDTAAIKAMAPPTGFIRKRSKASQTFVYWRSGNGPWARR